MAVKEAVQDMEALSRHHDTMTKRFNDPMYNRLLRTAAMERFLEHVEKHRTRFYKKHVGGEHLDKRIK